MRAGPPTPRLTGALIQTVRIDVVRQGAVIAEDLPAWDVRLEATVGRGVPQRLSYRLPSDWAPRAEVMHPAACYGQHSRVTLRLEDSLTGEVWDTELGDYLHTPATETDGAVEIDARDVAQRLAEDPDPWPSSPPPGATLEREAARLCGGVPVVVDERVAKRPVARTSQWGHDRLDALLELAEGCGAAVRSTAGGRLLVYPLQRRESADLVYPPGVIVSAPPPAPPASRPPSRWVGTIEIGEGERPRRESVVISREHLVPYAPQAYGRVTRLVSTAGARTGLAELGSAVAEAAAADMLTGDRRTLTLPLDPRVELGDIVQAVLPDGSTVTGRVSAYSMALSDPGSLMRLDVDTLLW